jgi:hypothetical protein
MRAIGSKSLALIGNTISIRAKLHRSLECVETLVALRGLGGLRFESRSVAV